MKKNKKIKAKKSDLSIYCKIKNSIKTFFCTAIKNYKINPFKWWSIFTLVLGTCIFIPLFSVGFWLFFTTPGTGVYNFDEIIALVLILTGLIGQMFLIGGLCVAMMWHSAEK